MSDDSLSTDAELLERYAVDGERAMHDPQVAALAAQHPELMRRLQRVLAVHRQRIAPDARLTVPGGEQLRRTPSQMHDQAREVPEHSPSRLWWGAREGRGVYAHSWRWAVGIVGGVAAVVLAFVAGRAGLVGDTVVTGPLTTYATAIGERATLTLADGSRVMLAPHSTLRVPKNFGRDTREVALEGEAYFNVARTSGTPFNIRTQSVVTRVLGTSFDVRRYPDDRNVRVVVEHGKVGVGTPRHTSAVLVGGNMGVVTDSTVTVTPVSDFTPYTGWTTGRLKFREVPVREVLSTLERWYGVRFQITDTTLAESRLTAVLDFSSTADLVQTLEQLLDVTATSSVTANGVVIRLDSRHPMRTESSRGTLRHELSAVPSEVGR